MVIDALRHAVQHSSVTVPQRRESPSKYVMFHVPSYQHYGHYTPALSLTCLGPVRAALARRYGLVRQ